MNKSLQQSPTSSSDESHPSNNIDSATDKPDTLTKIFPMKKARRKETDDVLNHRNIMREKEKVPGTKRKRRKESLELKFDLLPNVYSPVRTRAHKKRNSVKNSKSNNFRKQYSKWSKGREIEP